MSFPYFQNDDTSKEARSLNNNSAQSRFIDPLDVLSPVAGVLNGDFGIGLINPKVPFAKPGEDVDPSLAIAAAFSPVEPFIAPFRPFAMQYTGATAADIHGLKPEVDLVYPFLDSPKNVLGHIQASKKTRGGDGTLASMMSQASQLTPEQLEAYQKAIEQWKLTAQRRVSCLLHSCFTS